MNLRTASHGLRALVGATAFLTLAAISSAQTVDKRPEVKTTVLDRVSQILTKSAFVPGVDFTKWPEFLEGEKPKIDAAQNDDDFQRAVNEALAKFGTSHIVLTTPRGAEIRRSGSTVGVGITTQQTDEGLVIVRTVKDAPADQAGVHAGDIITAVDGKPVEGIKGIPGEEGTDVTLTIKRGPDSKDYKITRRKFSTLRQEELTWIDKDTAKINIYTFDFSYDPERVEKLMQDALRARNLIVDLRDNGGGAVINMEHFLGLLLPPDKPIGTFVSRSMVQRYTEATGDEGKDVAKVAAWSDRKINPRLNMRVPRFKGNLAVLVNRWSGSAAEITAAALRDNANATVVGQKSAGAVLVSVIVPAGEGFMLQYPLSDYVTIKGLRLEGNGVAPDVAVTEPKLRLPDAPDEAVTRAVAEFANIKSRTTDGR